MTESRNESMFGCNLEPTAVFYFAIVAAVIAPFLNYAGGGQQSGYFASIFGACIVIAIWVAIRLIWGFMSLFIGKEIKGVED